ncbi:MAG: hypothetical protein ACLU6H_08475 [Lachnospiraceae bacterium]
MAGDAWHFLPLLFGFIKTTALLAAMWDTKSNIEKMEKNEKSY